MKYIPTLFLLISSCILSGQTSYFIDSSNLLGGDRPTSFIFNGVVDWNKDLLDDVLAMDKGKLLSPYYQQAAGMPFASDDAVVIGVKEHWTIAVADLDGDGHRDMVIPGYTEPISILYGGDDSTAIHIIDRNTIYPQALSLVDVNSDGYLDLFLANDYGPNVVYINEGGRSWKFSPDYLGESPQPSITAGNYGCTWSDYDLDGDLDLYVAKCYGDAEDPRDPRRVNRLFEQVRPGVYVRDSANLRGLAFGAQSWTSNFGDLDNDGDLDILVTHHDSLAYLLRNDGGRYTRVESTSSVFIGGFPLQSLFRDIDNNGFLDIVVAGNPAYLFLNKGHWKFEKIASPFGLYSPSSMAIGDLNNDGFLDVYANYSFTHKNPQQDKLYINRGNDNHFIFFHLVGNSPNTDAVGAQIYLYANGEIQMRELRAGESYGIANSMLVHFGLGRVASVDSVVVHWPGGAVEHYERLTVGEVNVLEEGGCSTSRSDGRLSMEGVQVLCTGDTALLFAPENATNGVWNDGNTGLMRRVTQPGTFVFRWRDSTGCLHYSCPVTFVVDRVSSPGISFVRGEKINCSGEEVVLRMTGPPSGKWWEQLRSDTLRLDTSRQVWWVDSTQCGVSRSEKIDVLFVDRPAPPAIHDVTTVGGEVILLSNQSDTYWYSGEADLMPKHLGPRLLLPQVNRDTMVWADRRHVFSFGGEAPCAPHLNQMTDLAYHVDRKNVVTHFEVERDMVLRAVSTRTDRAGKRSIVITDPSGQKIFQKTVHLDTGTNRIPMDVTIPALQGTYRIATDTDTNQLYLGTVSPRLVRATQNFGYPFDCNAVYRIAHNTLSPHAVYYFFDWEVERSPLVCASDRVPVQIRIDTSLEVSSSWTHVAPVRLIPNPTHGQKVSVVLPDRGISLPAHGILYSSNGDQKAVLSHLAPGSNALEMSGFPSGMYLLLIWDAKGIYSTSKIIKW